MAASLAKSALDGAGMQTLPIVSESPSFPMLEYSAMARFGVPASRLPQGVEIMNQPAPIDWRLRFVIMAVVLFIAIESILIFTLLINRTKRKKTMLELSQQKALLSNIISSIPCSVYWKDRNLAYLGGNTEFARELGLDSTDAFIGKTHRELTICPIEADWTEEHDKIVLDERRPLINLERTITRRDGVSATILTSRMPLFNEQGEVYGILVVDTDISKHKEEEEERRAFESRLQQAQKLESLGVLAGGIAHDFNNLLMGVLANTELALSEAPPSGTIHPLLKEIERAAGHAAELARQMLAYSGRGRFVVEKINLNEIATSAVRLQEASVSRKTVLRHELAPDLPAMAGDPAQIRQAIMNLVFNAAESIEEHEGTVVIQTGMQYGVEPSQAEYYVGDFAPQGPCVYVEVSDTGAGMDADTLKRVFDPFFSTKFAGRGLGLAVVYGIVRSHSGCIRVTSEAGKGSAFRLLFPSLGTPPPNPVHAENASKNWRGQGTILLADDQEIVLNAGKRMLNRLGFQVVCAVDGYDAIEQFRMHASEIICVVLDLTMPRLNGEEAFEAIRRIQPDVRVILASGYSEEEIATRFAGKGLCGVLKKPFTLAELTQCLRNAIDGGANTTEHKT